MFNCSCSHSNSCTGLDHQFCYNRQRRRLFPSRGLCSCNKSTCRGRSHNARTGCQHCVRARWRKSCRNIRATCSIDSDCSWRRFITNIQEESDFYIGSHFWQSVSWRITSGGNARLGPAAWWSCETLEFQQGPRSNYSRSFWFAYNGWSGIAG